ncbi:hypothetical protein [Williamsoniiplasma lucivorax]|uniref:Uncharacterized protein n=1 Tax=Williamsoniiplasma lucivorax TaxID=209274 RepID=A0A2S5RF47_9MOLU|nr:hypothetical protein [Williamsoniiplasma lucivorax]PPE05956.1 hypothetical protein ELUCI_v1c02470 [Williamsoniiplasma lucivorax]
MYQIILKEMNDDSLIDAPFSKEDSTIFLSGIGTTQKSEIILSTILEQLYWNNKITLIVNSSMNNTFTYIYDEHKKIMINNLFWIGTLEGAASNALIRSLKKTFKVSENELESIIKNFKLNGEQSSIKIVFEK